MPIWPFNKESDEDKALKAAQKASIAALESGDIPLMARKRLTEQVASGTEFFSSTLSTNEYLLSKEAGYQILGTVMGSAFMRMPFNIMTASGEMTVVSHNRKEARRLAIARLCKEAEVLGAHGVIGVEVSEGNSDWGFDITEFTAQGTAIRIPDGKFLQQSKHIPFTSTLSGQEFWRLFEDGYWPMGIVAGNSSHFEYCNSQTQMLTASMFGGFSNQEITQYSQAFTECRRTAMNRLILEVGMLGADGAVDMTLDYQLKPYHVESNRARYMHFIFHFNVLGTAVIYRPDGMRRKRASGLVMIDLAGSGRRSLTMDEPVDNLAQNKFDDADALE
jgi:uncharacterized protein YbjQ (UPF0145 family)